MSGKRAFIELLKQEGVEYIFGNPGTTELPLMDALAVENELSFVLGLHEGVVLSMADGYAQASGKLAAANLHVTPGLGNAMGMLYDAQKAGAPILVTAGQHEQGFNVSEPILWGDLPPLARPLVKWSAEVPQLAELPRMVHRAAKTALAPPTGPVFLSLPGDILNAEADIDLGVPTRIAPRTRGDAQAIERAAELLAAAERPVLMAGDAVSQAAAHRELIELAELIGAAVYAESVPSTASFPASHPLFRGTIARLGPALRKTLSDYDLLFSVGGDLFTLSLPSGVEPMPDGLKVIHLDTDPWELGKNQAAEVAILGDPKATLPELTAALAARMTTDMRARASRRCQAMMRTVAAERAALKASAKAAAAKLPLEALALMDAIAELLPAEAVVVEEALSSGAGLRQLLKSDDAQSFYGNRGGGIGWGLPAAIGVKLALPERPVVALVGDGSAMYSCQALWTAAHYRIGVIFVIINNRSYRILKQRVNALKGHSAQSGIFVGMDLVDPAIDHVGLAKALGLAAGRAETIPETLRLLREALASGAPTLVDVIVDGAFKPV